MERDLQWRYKEVVQITPAGYTSGWRMWMSGCMLNDAGRKACRNGNNDLSAIAFNYGEPTIATNEPELQLGKSKTSLSTDEFSYSVYILPYPFVIVP